MKNVKIYYKERGGKYNFKVIANGLESKWGTLLQGDTKWIEDFRKFKWYLIAYLTQEEGKVLWEIV